MATKTRFFATTAQGIEPVLEGELKGIGVRETCQVTSGVYFEAGLETAYRACLWLRTANRVLMPVAEFEAKQPDELYDGVRRIDWSAHLHPSGTLAVDFFSARSRIDHSHYGALKVKDAVVDQFRDGTGVRPSVDLERPDIRINLHLLKNHATVSLDLSGESLHRRGYRTEGGMAPLKETLAAAILLQAGWRDIAAAGGSLMDPMCGSGTLPIEAALIAADSAPGLMRDYFGFLKWRQHDPGIWESLLAEAEEREAACLGTLPPIIGYDADARAIRNSLLNLEKAGLTGLVHFEKKSLADLVPHARAVAKPGLVVLNPPYGERIGKQQELQELYRELGRKLKAEFKGWRVSLFTGNIALGKQVGLTPETEYPFFNGTIKCRLFNFAPVTADNRPLGVEPSSGASPDRVVAEDVSDFVNRLRKNLKRLKSWRISGRIECFRAYDHDLPEYAVAIDMYGDRVQVQEYRAPASVDPQTAASRLQGVIAALPEVLQVPAANIFLKVRHRQQGKSKYGKLRSDGDFFQVQEGGHRFWVNLTDYLDTGLFLDHRITRRKIGEMANGKRFLNLFAYTGTATVYAAAGGAVSTTSVDSSKNYLEWAGRNLALNGIQGGRHGFIRAECVDWLAHCRDTYDLIFLDPPSFSNTRSTGAVFDVQRDHVKLIRMCLKILDGAGSLVFSNNLRNFKLDAEVRGICSAQDISGETLPPDFERRPNIHHCWLITR